MNAALRQTQEVHHKFSFILGQTSTLFLRFSLVLGEFSSG